MVNCSFCTKEIPRGTGKVYIRKDGRALQFCSNKCEKNMLKLGRKPVKYKWTRDVTKNTAAVPKKEAKAPSKEKTKTSESNVQEETKKEDTKNDQ